MCLLKDKKIICRKTGRAIQILTWNRNKKIKDIMHKYSKWIVEYCLLHNIGTIVIGYNPNWKQEINLGKKTNQNFVFIPSDKLVKMIKYKAEEIGISVIEKEESYTSKCSFLDGESNEHHNVYMGERISRGLFRSEKGTIINADVQGAYNIIKKAIPEAFKKLSVDWIEDVGLHPLRINPLTNVNNINTIGD
jgi:putative transposase